MSSDGSEGKPNFNCNWAKVIDDISQKHHESMVESSVDVERASNTINALYKSILESVIKLYRAKNNGTSWDIFKDSADKLAEIQKTVKENISMLYSAGFTEGSLAYSKDFLSFVSGATDITLNQCLSIDGLQKYLCRSSDPPRQQSPPRRLILCRRSKSTTTRIRTPPALLSATTSLSTATLDNKTSRLTPVGDQSSVRSEELTAGSCRLATSVSFDLSNGCQSDRYCSSVSEEPDPCSVLFERSTKTNDLMNRTSSSSTLSEVRIGCSADATRTSGSSCSSSTASDDTSGEEEDDDALDESVTFAIKQVSKSRLAHGRGGLPTEDCTNRPKRRRIAMTAADSVPDLPS